MVQEAGRHKEGRSDVTLDTEDTASSRDGVDGQASEAEVRARCLERLLRLGVRPGITSRKLHALLEKQEGRSIDVEYQGLPHLRGLNPSISARLDRRAERARILILVAESKHSDRGNHCLTHEQCHMIVEPRKLIVSTTSTDIDPGSGLEHRCESDDVIEREVEMTAHLLHELLHGTGALWNPRPLATGPGMIITRRGGSRGLL